MDLSRIVDLDRYPIHEPGGAGFEATVAEARAGLAHDGCAVLRGFVKPGAVARMAAESQHLKPGTKAIHRPWVPYPPYHIPEGESWPEDHPRAHRTSRCNRFICYDMLAHDSAVRALYESPAMTELARRCAEAEVLYPYGDPLGACALSIQEAGEELPWHFDLTHFVVSLLIQAPEGGGKFQYAPDIRGEGDERYDAVAALLAGSDAGVVELDSKPGDLQLFEGRHALHRVTAPEGPTWRCIALLSYCEQPGVIGDEAMQRHLFGRVCQEAL